jgi:hypothetical protein
MLTDPGKPLKNKIRDNPASARRARDMQEKIGENLRIDSHAE